MEAALRELVRQRAADRCEYCRIRQVDDRFFRFHIEHITPRQHGGEATEVNLALSCHHCNLHKGPNLTGIDPETGVIAVLFNPRTQMWGQHFSLRSGVVVGRTPTGRATVRVLAINAPDRVDIRAISRH